MLLLRFLFAQILWERLGQKRKRITGDCTEEKEEERSKEERRLTGRTRRSQTHQKDEARKWSGKRGRRHEQKKINRQEKVWQKKKEDEARIVYNDIAYLRDCSSTCRYQSQCYVQCYTRHMAETPRIVNQWLASSSCVRIKSWRHALSSITKQTSNEFVTDICAMTRWHDDIFHAAAAELFSTPSSVTNADEKRVKAGLTRQTTRKRETRAVQTLLPYNYVCVRLAVISQRWQALAWRVTGAFIYYNFHPSLTEE